MTHGSNLAAALAFELQPGVHILMSTPPDRSTAAERRLVPVLLGLSVSTGIVDAVSYLGLGHLFTANMTGNFVLLGFALAGAQGLSIARSSTALAGFLVGAVLGGRITKRMSSGPQNRRLAAACAAEATLLLAALATSIGHSAEHPNASARLFTAIVLTAVAMGIRNAVVRGLGVPDVTTTVLTMTVTGLAADSTLAGGNNPRWPRRLASVVAVTAGAAVGAVLVRRSLAWPLAVCVVVACVCAFAAHLQSGDSR